MLDLGFLEDVERSSRLTPNCRQTALFSATMPPPIRKLADAYLYDPVHRAGQGRDADRRLRRAVPARGQERGQGRQAHRGPARGAPGPVHRLRPHQDRHGPPLPQAARQGDERQGAARRHVAGLARRRDARLQGRPRADPRGHGRRRPRPGHLDGDPRRQLRRPGLARRLRAPHRPHGPRRPRGPRDHLRRAAADQGARGHRAAHRHEDRALGARRDHRAGPGRGEAQAALQAAAHAQRRRALPPRCWPAPGRPRASRSPTSSRR